ncbi:MAG TPA: alpha-amylase family glycosyl hydrolase, partial [Actinomycetota bacterium]
TYVRELAVTVDRERARSSAWYELFPRSTADEPGRHGTFDDVIARLPYVSELGFDVLYLPPIHPIGRVHRKGRNNAPVAGPDDPGSPWAIGSDEGGHTAVHPELGTLADFERLVAAAARHGIEVAIDVAFQCAPDHPWVREHPEWFRLRPDGAVQYAENPPKRYEDIYPLDFETADWKALWEALLEVVRFWIARGVRIFRVDNPHTKPFAFWEWAIGEVKREHPDVIFLSEAFTRPKVMYRLAKLGFTQSYTYFAWRNTKRELTDYLTELTRTGAAEFFRPSFWPNTPDILTAYLQEGGEPAFAVRLVLAATLGATYGIYGPAFELCERTPREPGSEEYLRSEKYEVRSWDLHAGARLQELIARVNRIRREHPALRTNATLRFHGIDDDELLAYSKVSEDRSDAILVVVNLDPFNVRSGWTDIALWELGIEEGADVEAVDLLTGDRFSWRGAHNFVKLDPAERPAHVLSVRPTGVTVRPRVREARR